MTVQLRKVDGGWEVFIPDEMAAQVGVPERSDFVMRVSAWQVMIGSPTFIREEQSKMFDRITPETLPDPREPYDPPVGFERAG
jgi:hypothetical protein